MSQLLAIDPGTTESAFVVYETETGRPVVHDKVPNDDLRCLMYEGARGFDCLQGVEACVIEMVASYGMPVGAEVFETVYWIGRYAETWAEQRDVNGDEPVRMFRRQVKMHLCGSPRANDATIRQALIDRYGPGKETAVGRKAAPGPLYGIKADRWAALAVAVTYADQSFDGAAVAA